MTKFVVVLSVSVDLAVFLACTTIISGHPQQVVPEVGFSIALV